MGYMARDEEALRRYAISARRSMGSVLAAQKSRNAVEHILEHEAYRRAEYILAYLAAPGELDVSALCVAAREAGKKVAYPIWDGQSWMIAAIADEKDMETDRYGMREPSLVHARIVIPEKLDLILIPGLGYDEKGRRLGWGSGQYDRFLPLCSKGFKMGVVFEEQVLEHVIQKESGVSVDAVATDTGIRECE